MTRILKLSKFGLSRVNSQNKKLLSCQSHFHLAIAQAIIVFKYQLPTRRISLHQWLRNYFYHLKNISNRKREIRQTLFYWLPLRIIKTTIRFTHQKICNFPIVVSFVPKNHKRLQLSSRSILLNPGNFRVKSVFLSYFRLTWFWICFAIDWCITFNQFDFFVLLWVLLWLFHFVSFYYLLHCMDKLWLKLNSDSIPMDGFYLIYFWLIYFL